MQRPPNKMWRYLECKKKTTQEFIHHKPFCKGRKKNMGSKHPTNNNSQVLAAIEDFRKQIIALDKKMGKGFDEMNESMERLDGRMESLEAKIQELSSEWELKEELIIEKK